MQRRKSLPSWCWRFPEEDQQKEDESLTQHSALLSSDAGPDREADGPTRRHSCGAINRRRTSLLEQLLQQPFLPRERSQGSREATPRGISEQVHEDEACGQAEGNAVHLTNAESRSSSSCKGTRIAARHTVAPHAQTRQKPVPRRSMSEHRSLSRGAALTPVLHARKGQRADTELRASCLRSASSSSGCRASFGGVEDLEMEQDEYRMCEGHNSDLDQWLEGQLQLQGDPAEAHSGALQVAEASAKRRTSTCKPAPTPAPRPAMAYLLKDLPNAGCSIESLALASMQRRGSSEVMAAPARADAAKVVCCTWCRAALPAARVQGAKGLVRCVNCKRDFDLRNARSVLLGGAL
eukprot:TRINITY_DN111017_c0_g1_i1.p1 TRINITY_DN111017_c0_g1~~TRINITY_DN111017_c0_g1_i1.p1  ORF type:complete len:351 (-),score=41.05 TRINITY_DN111017_c0_g1_i1:92-1144(-)